MTGNKEKPEEPPERIVYGADEDVFRHLEWIKEASDYVKYLKKAPQSYLVHDPH